MSVFGSFARAVVQAPARRLARTAAALRLVARTAKRGGSVRLGPDVLVRNPQLVDCAHGVTIGDGAELIVELTPGQTSRIELGEQVKLGKRCQLGANPGLIRIGAHASLHTGTFLLGHITVGRYTLLSANIFASSGDHYAFDRPHALIRDQDREAHARPQDPLADGIVIEEDCWIGWGAILKRGVHIGRGAVVGANAVVTRDVAPYTVVGGQPAREIKRRLDFSPRTRLQAANAEDAPYLYRGFLQLASERAALEQRYPGRIGALAEAILVMPAAGDYRALALRGTTLCEGSSIEIGVTDGVTASVLPAGAGQDFDLRVPLAPSAAVASAHADSLPRLAGHRVVVIRCRTGSHRPAASSNSPCWAFSEASLVE